jgi:DNA processing protein
MDEKIRKIRNCLWLTALNRQIGLTSGTIGQLLRIWPDLDKLIEVSPKSLAENVAGPPDKIKRLLSSLKDKRWLELLADQAVGASRQGIRTALISDDDFPARLKQISGCPLVLYYRGERYAEIMSSGYFVTMIGTRTPTAYGRIVAEKITADLVRSQVVIVSGLARGVDATAHRAALKSGGMTIAVVGSGPDLPYPSENAELMDQIAAAGLIISEHPPGTPPRKQHFPARNRILSGLSDAVAVIEASRDSGTMITAGFAGDQGRDIFAVPGSILSPFSQGCNHLIREGAEVLESAADLLWRLPFGQVQTSLEQAIRRDSLPSKPDLGKINQQQSQIIRALSGHPLTLAEIAGQAAITLSETAIIMTGLEIENYIQCEKGRYSLTRKALSCI